MKSNKDKAAKPKSKKAKKKSAKKRTKKSVERPDDTGIIVIDDDLKIDTEKELEERRAYLEEARSQDASEWAKSLFVLRYNMKYASIMFDHD